MQQEIITDKSFTNYLNLYCQKENIHELVVSTDLVDKLYDDFLSGVEIYPSNNKTFMAQVLYGIFSFVIASSAIVLLFVIFDHNKVLDDSERWLYGLLNFSLSYVVYDIAFKFKK